MTEWVSATSRCAKLVVTTISLIAGAAQPAWSQSASQIPRYRHIDPASTVPAELPQGIVRLLADKDFAPFSFVAADGSQAGLSVELAREACAELRLACEIVALPFSELLPALERGDGDAIVTGARLDASIFAKADSTRPYFLSTGQFFIERDTTLSDTTTRTLGGKRLGYVRGTLHGAFIEKYYARSALTPFETTAAMFESLKARQLDTAFSDSLFAQFWLNGPSAAACCIPLGRAFVDRATFSRELTFLARKDRKNLRESLDFALDRLEEKGLTAKVIARYVPGPVW
jgi:polar amino acid transport system substrate-binding protein